MQSTVNENPIDEILVFSYGYMDEIKEELKTYGYQKNQIISFKNALSCDPLSAFGGVIAINSIISKKLAPTGAHLLFIAKNIERVADYVTDIAEQVYFLVNGKVLSDERPKADESSFIIPD